MEYNLKLTAFSGNNLKGIFGTVELKISMVTVERV